MTHNIHQMLQQINWNFSDYNSSKYPIDLNSIPWYPATFVPLIPKFLIPLLTEEGDVVFDPFGGKGTTAIETLRAGRIFLYNDLNPYAFDIMQGIFYVIRHLLYEPDFLSGEHNVIMKMPESKLTTAEYVKEQGVSQDTLKWYEDKTLRELLGIVRLIRLERDESEGKYLVRKLALSSILKVASSQPGHFTYVTDNCKPSTLVRKEAQTLYLDRIDRILRATEDLINQFRLSYPKADLETLIDNSKVYQGDSRHLHCIDSQSVDLVLTSPPYLCAQDYVKTMRLTNLFFPNDDFEVKAREEIGPRSKRKSDAKTVVHQFYSDMKRVFAEIERILKPNGYFCLVFGQGKGKITSEYNTINDLREAVLDLKTFEVVFQTERKIGSRVIQVGGVEKESIFVFRKIGVPNTLGETDYE